VVSLLFFGSIGTIAWYDRRPAPTVKPPFTFEEVSRASGIEFVHHAAVLDHKLDNVMPHVAGIGAAVSVGDANDDGWPDLYVTNSALGEPNALYVNQGDGTFRDLAREAGVAHLNISGRGASMGSIWGDYDNDGREDLFVYRWGYTALFHNDGGLSFSEVTKGAGLERWMNANAAVWLDYDRDGLLDVYVCGYFSEAFDLFNLAHTRIMQESFEFANNGGHNFLFRNQGDGTFRDVTAETGCDSTRWTLGVAAADLDEDGWIDLYLANDYGPEELFLNSQGVRFERARDAGLDESSKSGMCVALGDFENKGRLGVFVTNISSRGFLFQGNNLRMNRLIESQRFFNIAEDKVADGGWAWGAQFGDFDNDGWADLFVANGFISADRDRDYWYAMGKIAGAIGPVFQDARNWEPIGDRSLSGYERSRVLWNRRGRRFTDVAAAVGCDDLYDGRAVALADLANRGALDVVVANQKGPLLVYRTRSDPANHWIELRLVGTRSNRSAIGAEVTIHCGESSQTRVIDGGSGFSSQNDRRAHFGLGACSRVERAVIRWPSGGEQVVENLQVDALTVIEEGG